MISKRVILLAGHYGSGKTNIAVNLAERINADGKPVAICDLDIVNPYFRTKDSEEELSEKGIKLIVSKYANTNLDAPALPKEIYPAIADLSTTLVMDIGGDDRGALALGRYAPSILEENNYEMIFVANFYRPLTTTADEALEVMKEVEAAGGIRFTAIINNSNLGKETSPNTVLCTEEEAEKLSKLSGLPILFTTVEERLEEELEGKVKNLIGLHLQKKPV